MQRCLDTPPLHNSLQHTRLLRNTLSPGTSCTSFREVQILQHTTTLCNKLEYSATNSHLEHRVMRRCSWFTMEANCNTLQHTATHCNTLQHAAPRCTTLQHTAPHCNSDFDTLQRTAISCNTLLLTAPGTSCKFGDIRASPWRPAALHCTTLQHTAPHCTLHHPATYTATHCTTLQHVATHCTWNIV